MLAVVGTGFGERLAQRRRFAVVALAGEYFAQEFLESPRVAAFSEDLGGDGLRGFEVGEVVLQGQRL